MNSVIVTTMATSNTTIVKQNSAENALMYVSPNQVSKKRSFKGTDENRKKSKAVFRQTQSVLPRVLVGIIEDYDNESGLPHVYGYTKFWYDKDYIKFKRDQLVSNLNWWRDKNVTVYEDCNDSYDEETMLDKFYEEIMTEINNIEDHIEEFDKIVLNVLNQEALANLINRKKDDAIAFFLFNLLHFQKLTVYKSECYMVAFETVTVFENDGVLVGELIVEAGKKMKWKKHE